MHRKLFLSPWAVLWLGLAVAMLAASPAAAVKYKTPIRISTAAQNQGPIQVNDSGQAVWLGGSPAQVYFFDGTTTKQISDGSTYPGGSGARINTNGWAAWNASDDTSGNVWLYSNGALQQITTSGCAGAPDINDSGGVVYNDYVFDPKIQYYTEGIFLYTGGLPSQLTTDGGGSPAINNDGQIVYTDLDGQVHLIRGGNQVISLPGTNNILPQINNSGQAVWMGNNGSSPMQIYFYDGSQTRNISNNSNSNSLSLWAGQVGKQINNNGKVVWYDKTTGDVYLYSGGVKKNLTTNISQGNSNPTINDFGQVVWVGSDSTGDHIYVYSDGAVQNVVNLTIVMSWACPVIDDWGQIFYINSYDQVYRISPIWDRPVASFIATPPGGAAPLTIQFSDHSTGIINQWTWDFGDGGASAAQNPSHTYQKPGSYKAKLTVTGPGGSSSKTATITVTIPVANFSPFPQTGPAPLTVQFTDNSTGAVTNWAWDCGDGNTSTVQSPIHTYNNPGSYTAKLTVTGPYGSNSKTAVINVTAAPSPAVNLWSDNQPLFSGVGESWANAVGISGTTAIVAGQAFDVASDKWLWVVKAYDTATGAPKWQDPFDLGDGRNAARAVAVSGATTYVAGLGDQGGTRYLVVRAYTANSTTALWTFKVPANQAGNYFVGIAAQKSTVVAFANDDTSGHMNGIVHGINPQDGSLKWSKNLTTNNVLNQANAIVLCGSVAWVAGFEKDSGKTYWLVQAFDSSGAYKWTVKSDWGDGDSGCRAIAASTSTIFAGGYASIAGKINAILRSYSASKATPKWTKTFDMGFGLNRSTAVAVSGANVFWAGNGNGVDRERGFVSAYNASNGVQRWTTEIDLGGTFVYPNSLATSKSAVYTAGYAKNNADRSDWFVRAYALNGYLRWSDQVDLAGDSFATGIAVGKESVIAVGYGKNASGQRAWLVKAYAP